VPYPMSRNGPIIPCVSCLNVWHTHGWSLLKSSLFYDAHNRVSGVYTT
jgi:hypothetical protein